MELREFYEFDFWPPESDRQVAAQLVAREVSVLVAVRRSVSDVEWIQQVQSCISAALVRSAAQAEPTVTIGGADVDGGACQLTEGVMNAASNCRDERLTDVLSMMLSTMHRVRVGHVVAQWRAGLTRAAQQQSTQLTKRQRKRLLKGKKKDKRGRERGLARARWAGTWRAMVQRGVGSWVCAVGDQRIRRAAALVAAAVDAELVLCRRVWHELIDSFYWWQVGRGVVEQTACIERRSGGGDGCGGERVAYDWTCTRCGWGGQLVKAGCATCKKCEWQGWKWCEAAGSLDAEDREEAMENIVRKQQDFSGRRIGDRLRRRMLLESVRLKGMLEEKRVGMWQQQVLDTVQVGLQQGDTGDVRKLIAEAVDAAVGVQIGGVWLPRPRLRQSAKEYVVGEVQAAEEGSGWSGEAVGGGEESGEVAAADSESFQFLSYGVKPVDKAGRLPDWCDESEEEDENEGLEVWIAAEEAVEAANDALVAAEMAEDLAYMAGCGLKAAVQEVEAALQVYDDAEEALMQVEDQMEERQMVVQAAEEQAAEARQAEEQAAAMVQAEEQAAAMVQAEEQAAAMVQAEEQAAAMVQAEEQAAAMVQAEEQAAAMVQAEEQAAAMVQAEEQAAAMVQAEEQAAAMVQAEEQAAAWCKQRNRQQQWCKQRNRQQQWCKQRNRQQQWCKQRNRQTQRQQKRQQYKQRQQ